MSCAEIALIPTLEKKMKDGEPGPGGGGGGSESVLNEKKCRKRKSEEVPISPNGTKKARKWKHRFKTKRQKFPKKPRSVDGDAPKSKRKIRRQRRLTESFNAPFNSTQFIMNDHADEAVKHLNSTLNIKNAANKKEGNDDDSESDTDYTMDRPVRRINRARESSFSIESDDDYYYSSPEDEEEFMNKEFIKDYDSVRNDRLVDMSKDELINEYLQMEQRIEALEKRLSSNKSQDSPKPSPNNQVSTIPDTIKNFQKEITRLESENSQLKKAHSTSVSCSSSCSSSSSSDSSSSESESEDNEEGEEAEDGKNKNSNPEDGNAQDVDTGYESGQSNKKSLDPNEEKEVIVINTQQEDEKPEENEEIFDDTISVNCITSTSQS